MELTTEQERQLMRLLQVITEHLSLFPKTSGKSQVIKIPFAALEAKQLSLAEAENLIGHINRVQSEDNGAIDILNGEIYRYQGVIGTMVTEVFEELDGVNLGDDKKFLLLWLHDFEKLQKAVLRSLEQEFLGSEMESDYVKGKIVVETRNIEIKPNTNAAAFCKTVFEQSPLIEVPFADIWEVMKGVPSKSFKRRDWKSVENTLTGLNRKLRLAKIPKLFEQHKDTVIRLY